MQTHKRNGRTIKMDFDKVLNYTLKLNDKNTSNHWWEREMREIEELRSLIKLKCEQIDKKKNIKRTGTKWEANWSESKQK